MKVVLRTSCLISCLTSIALLLVSFVQPVQAGESPTPTKAPARPLAPIRPQTTCPVELEATIQALLRDLPHYINRTNHQIGGSQSYRYAIATSQPNFVPLPVVTSTIDPNHGGLHQVFFTVLERQYDTRQQTDYQTYHWLFLAHTEAGWQLAILYSRDGLHFDGSREPSPLRETTQEAIGRAIRSWLRDCRAKAVQL